MAWSSIHVDQPTFSTSTWRIHHLAGLAVNGAPRSVSVPLSARLSLESLNSTCDVLLDKAFKTFAHLMILPASPFPFRLPHHNQSSTAQAIWYTTGALGLQQLNAWSWRERQACVLLLHTYQTKSYDTIDSYYFSLHVILYAHTSLVFRNASKMHISGSVDAPTPSVIYYSRLRWGIKPYSLLLYP